MTTGIALLLLEGIHPDADAALESAGLDVGAPMTGAP